MSDEMRLVLIVSHFSGYQVLRHVVSDYENIKVVGVITDNPFRDYSNAKKRAIWNYGEYPQSMKYYSRMVPNLCDELGIGCYRDSVKDPAFLESLMFEWRPHAAVMSIFGQILQQEFLDCFPLGVYNIHPCGNTWPSFPGPTPHKDMLEAKATLFRMAAYKVNTQVDAGQAVHLSQPIPIPPLTEQQFTWITQSAVVYTIPPLLEILLKQYRALLYNEM